MENISVTREDVLKSLESIAINKSAGPDDIHPRVLFELRHEISGALTTLFNRSLLEGTVPLDWNTAKVTALHKKGSRSSPKNYRPISLTCIVCKIFEGLVRKNLLAYLLNNDLISNAQHGFLPKRSCVSNLLECLDKWTQAWDNRENVDIIYLDFAKAFDKVCHSKLIIKMHSLGISQQIINWTKSFLSNRTQCVQLNGNCSTPSKVSGVPQGSVMGPVLFADLH